MSGGLANRRHAESEKDHGLLADDRILRKSLPLAGTIHRENDPY